MDASRVPPLLRQHRFDLVTFVGSRVVDLAITNEANVNACIADYWELVAKGRWLIICENTDYSGRIEPAAGWHLKTEDEINRMCQAIPVGAKPMVCKGLVRARWLYQIPIVRQFTTSVVGWGAPKLGLWVKYIVAAQRPAV